MIIPTSQIQCGPGSDGPMKPVRPRMEVGNWLESPIFGIYFYFPGNFAALGISIAAIGL
jgi:hypothetical protein